MTVAVFIMTSFIVFKIQSMHAALDTGLADIRNDMASIRTTNADLAKNLEQSGSEVAAFRKEVNDRERAREKKAEMLASLRKARARIAEADALRAAGKFEEAAARLIATKDPLWMAGDYYVDQQGDLRGLMEPIDITSAKWMGGDKAASAEAVLARIDNIISRAGAE
ncbi:MAG: hypothetical protein FNT29_01865 [Halothiobacillaceae bacterium]|nr:MAG: hypothetical protein FNT29_01865 [Halothiobacillaceae bacterium]